MIVEKRQSRAAAGEASVAVADVSPIQTAFMRHDLNDWAEAERHSVPYSAAQVERFSPKTRAILEIRTRRDLEILEKIYANSVLLGDEGPEGWGIKYAQGDFNMTSDSDLFSPRPGWEEKGYRPDIYGRWIKFRGQVRPGAHDLEIGWIPLADGSGTVSESDIEGIALPLYEGRMIGQFDFSNKGWVSGKGRSAVWREIPWDAKVVEPQYLMSEGDYAGARDKRGDPKALRGTKLAFMDVTSATNERTMIAGIVHDRPCGNSAPVLTAGGSLGTLTAILNSTAYDYVARARCSGLHLNYFVIEESPLPPSTASALRLNPIALQLAAAGIPLAPSWANVRQIRLHSDFVRRGWRATWALTVHERVRTRCILDALTAELYHLDWNELAWILRDCDHSREVASSSSASRRFDPKGFWRVDKERDPELRQTVLTLAAFRDLKDAIATCGDRELGIEAFCHQNNGDGWMVPETLCLADLGLGHDERAKKPQPVRERLGERFLPWQLEQSSEESWKECEIHSRNILGEAGHARLQAAIRGAVDDAHRATSVHEGPAQYGFGFAPPPEDTKGRGRKSGKARS